MSEAQSKPTGPDLMTGIPLAELSDGQMLLGHVGGDAVLLTRVGQELFAIGATCTHYSAPLSEGIIVGDTVRCPWHHACFSLRTGEPLRPPALNPVECWRVERQGDMVVVRERASHLEALGPPRRCPCRNPY
jgi:nitrite reductase/ring-hydroxylating ferredoxin subunit